MNCIDNKLGQQAITNVVKKDFTSKCQRHFCDEKGLIGFSESLKFPFANLNVTLFVWEFSCFV